MGRAGSGLYSRPVADLPVRLSDARLQDDLASVVDREGKIPRALADLGPIADRDVVVLHADTGLRVAQLRAIGGRVVAVPPAPLEAQADASADVIVSCWADIRAGDRAAADEVAEAVRLLRPAGRLLVVQDYGRDDVSALLRPAARERQLAGWSHPHGPFLANGFKVRVVHCWWSWESREDAATFLVGAFGDGGAAVAAAMTRPRLSYKVAVYHRSRGDAARGAPPGAAA